MYLLTSASTPVSLSTTSFVTELFFFGLCCCYFFPFFIYFWGPREGRVCVMLLLCADWFVYLVVILCAALYIGIVLLLLTLHKCRFYFRPPSFGGPFLPHLCADADSFESCALLCTRLCRFVAPLTFTRWPSFLAPGGSCDFGVTPITATLCG